MSLSKCVLTWATGRRTPLIRCHEPIFCTHTCTTRDASEIKPVYSSQSSFTFLYLLTSHSPLLLSPCVFSPTPTTPKTHLLSSLSTHLSVSIYPPFPCLSSYACPSCHPPLSSSSLSLFFFLPVTTFPGLIAILSAGKCFVTSG